MEGFCILPAQAISLSWTLPSLLFRCFFHPLSTALLALLQPLLACLTSPWPCLTSSDASDISNFGMHVNGAKHALVEFYAPCDALPPGLEYAGPWFR